jgi:Fe-S oxidoreductase
MKNVAASKADILATACPACLIQLDYGVRRGKVPVEVAHISQVVLKRCSA